MQDQGRHHVTQAAAAVDKHVKIVHRPATHQGEHCKPYASPGRGAGTRNDSSEWGGMSSAE
eukprot:4960692-Prymnesium_polylepis.1